MILLYNLGIRLYYAAIAVWAFFSDERAKNWMSGRKKLFSQLQSFHDPSRPVAWFHAASLGEFEQGRTLIEAFRKKHPEYRILLTFFSPSGYLVKKDYPQADLVTYLPLDTRANARRFIEIVDPRFAVFIKYEYWFNFLRVLHKRKIPIYVASAIFRSRQHFFRWYGRWSLRQLGNITHFFVQDENSLQLLNRNGFSNVSISGDTRFDRVSTIAGQVISFPIVEKFIGSGMLLVAGSTWPDDDDVVYGGIHDLPQDARIIIAPHEVEKARVGQVMMRFSRYQPLAFSEANLNNVRKTRVLVIDSIGMLSRLYYYCDIAYIGGGFNKGIHNILEAVTFGKPVLFGPNYGKFREANELVALGGAFPVKTGEEMALRLKKLTAEKELYEMASGICKSYIARNTGATEKILSVIEKQIFGKP